jgi:hypothetical protein
VVQVDAAGLAAGEAAPVPVAFAGRAPQRGRGLAGAAAGVEGIAVGVVEAVMAPVPAWMITWYVSGLPASAARPLR